MGVSFLSAEDLILARLKDFMPKNVELKSIDEIKTVKDLSQFNETVYCTYAGFDLGDTKGKGQAQKIRQYWTVISAIREPDNGGDDGILQRKVASPIMDQIISALLGHKLATGYDELYLAPTNNQTYDEGFAFFDLTFSTLISLRGSSK